MGELIPFPRRPRWPALYFRFWNESLDRLTDYLATLKHRESDMTDLKFEYPKEEPLMITTRTFDAPRELVWKCFSEPQHIARWFGPKSISPVIRIDKFEFRVGGKWRYITQRPDGSATIVFYGTYKDIQEPERIVNTFAVEAMVAEDDLLTETHTFEARGDKTFYRAVANLGTMEAREGVIAGGMEAGARESIAQLDELLAELQEMAK
jgi:uncharacterized protein YndB with AHSA1/START domain